MKSNKGFTGLKPRCQKNCVPFRRLWGNLPCLSSFSRSPTFLGSWPLSSIFKASNMASLSHFFHSHIFPWLSIARKFFNFKNAGDYTGLILTFLIIVTSAKSFFPQKVTYSQIPEIKMWIFLGDHYFAYHIPLSASQIFMSAPYARYIYPIPRSPKFSTHYSINKSKTSPKSHQFKSSQCHYLNHQ